MKSITAFSRYILFSLLLVGFSTSVFAQENNNDSIVTPAKKEKNLKFSILGGPGYTPDFGFVIGGSTLLTFRTNPQDTAMLRSVLPVAFGLTFGEGVGINFTLRPQLFFKGDRFRIMGQYIYKNTGDNYYGVGYVNNGNLHRSDSTTLYYSSMLQVNPVILFRLKDSHFFAGPNIDMVYDKITKPSQGVINDPYYRKQGGDSTGLSSFNITWGASLSYDTRDMPANASKGVYFDFTTGYSAKALGSDFNYGIMNIDYRQYKSFGKRRTLAWTVNSKNSFGDVPLSRLPKAGSPFDLRGYYMGQYRDKSAHFMLAEYRHMINTSQTGFWSKLANRLGFATWAGTGFIGPNPVKIEGVLPNIGAGLRIEVQPRLNFRMDVGYSTREKQTLLYFNMTEAF